MLTPEEMAIKKLINDIWDKYDNDRSGELNKDQSRNFIIETIGKIGQNQVFNESLFEEIFEECDKN